MHKATDFFLKPLRNLKPLNYSSLFPVCVSMQPTTNAGYNNKGVFPSLRVRRDYGFVVHIIIDMKQNYVLLNYDNCRKQRCSHVTTTNTAYFKAIFSEFRLNHRMRSIRLYLYTYYTTYLCTNICFLKGKQKKKNVKFFTIE